MANGSLVKGFRSAEVAEALDLCLSCKGCSSDCPAGVDMATYKSEVLYQRYRRRLRPPSHYALGWLPRWARLASRAPGLANGVLNQPVLAATAKRLGGIDARRPLPDFAAETFREWFDARPATAGAPLSIVINPGGGGNPGALTGNYAFFLNGFNSSGAWTLAGSFISDGNGHITSGVVDRNSVGSQPFNTTVSGTYWIAANGLNTLTIQGQSFGPVTFAFDLSASGSGRIIEYDDTTGQGSRGSGVLRKADPTAFSLSTLNGGWVMGMTGVNSSGQSRQVVAGQMSLANGTISNGTGDINEGGTYSTITFSGNVPSIDAQTGRGVATIQSTFGTSHQAVYVVSASELVMEQIDAENPLQVGSVLQQSGSFNNGSLNGLSVLYFQAIHGGDGLDQSGAAIYSSNGNGTGNIIAMDEDTGGTIRQRPPGEMDYTVAANGAVNFGAGSPAGFLISQNHGFFVGTNSNSMIVTMEPQTGGPFSNASIAGTYAAGTLPPLDYLNGRNEVLLGPADGLGTLTLRGDSSDSSGLDQHLGTVVNYSIASNGRGTAEAQGDQAPAVVYVISPTKLVIMLPQTDAKMYVFGH